MRRLQEERPAIPRAQARREALVRDGRNAPGVSVGRTLLRQVQHALLLEQGAARAKGREHGADPGTQTRVPDRHGDASSTVTLRSQKIMLGSKSGHAPIAHHFVKVTRASAMFVTMQEYEKKLTNLQGRLSCSGMFFATSEWSFEWRLRS